MNITVCKFAPRKYIDTLPPYIKKWTEAAGHPNSTPRRNGNHRKRPIHGKRKKGAKNKQRKHNQIRRRQVNSNNYDHKWKEILQDAYDALKPPHETTNQYEINEKVKEWLDRRGLDPYCKSRTNGQIVNFENIERSTNQTKKIEKQCVVKFALALKIYETKKRTNKTQTEQKMWEWYFHQTKTNQRTTNKINAATIEKAIRVLKQSGIEPMLPVVNAPAAPPPSPHTSDTCPVTCPGEQCDEAYTAWI
jgi:hypothetical protein